MKLPSYLSRIKAARMNQFPRKFLWQNAEGLTYPFSKIINLLSNITVFSNVFKVIKLKPLSMKGSKTDAKKYRPISFFPLVPKIMKKSVHYQWKAI